MSMIRGACKLYRNPDGGVDVSGLEWPPLSLMFIQGGAAKQTSRFSNRQGRRIMDSHHLICSAMHTDLGYCLRFHGIKAKGKAPILE